jgi:hypothetical protein
MRRLSRELISALRLSFEAGPDVAARNVRWFRSIICRLLFLHFGSKTTEEMEFKVSFGGEVNQRKLQSRRMRSSGGRNGRLPRPIASTR